ncbi:hypothetical protein C1Y08_24785 [Pseudomonas sp. FW306-02-F02-AA]|uniref:Inclusion body protein n=1 Tax=Pseudomonas fluorescens TaxID=294 RepID=A0A0N9W8E8_PSEFL|nr:MULTISPECIES: hypothetical protein [Pseudomonas]ALI03278.1 hypothetical protein AO353_20140 [Pseudomonas fluorescens]PMZ01865.1 hypothetical protein C1Y07_23115 [Pseudomonas sp. FW306-02-F02-AB]PMZ07567.1 hypothetical protein C1Y06_24180 [Pseudomonas sp. FW306-02-H06C]PMZ13285.1 hypothetical protein C1Y08_24785 [Pseudomonas sp. FW306-02-F02-AA]PMZ19288.1 hypothetical protein C1Y09_24610 [Pseudomonas sp. FW306-02-F08-AA]
MKSVNVLIVVDVENALASGDLQGNVYLIDSNKHCGSSSEGQAELYTACVEGQYINWAVAPLSPSNDVQIVGFTGQMVNDRICLPKSVPDPSGNYWKGQVEAQGYKGNVQYSVVLSMDGKQMTFDPFLKIQ